MKKMQYLGTIMSLIILSQQHLFSQTILNGGFENNTFTPGCQYQITNSNYNSQISNITAYSSIDWNDIIHDGSCPGTGASNNGNWNGTIEYLNSFANVTGNTALSFELSSSVTSGNQYTLTYFDKAKILTPDYIIGTVSVGISQTPTSNGTNIGTSVPVQDIWTQRSFTFTATFSGTAYITATAVAHSQVGKVAWMHIDDFTLELILPVELISFNSKKDNGGIVLEWITASETNNQGFQIQKSKNGRDWEIIDFIEGKRTTNEINEYQYQDTNPFSGNNYYRLKQIDFDGAFEYSKVITVEYDNSERSIEVFPNPSNGLINLQIDNPSNRRMRITISDNLGRKVWESELIEGETNWRKEIKIEGNGIYFITAQIGDEIFSERLRILNEK